MGFIRFHSEFLGIYGGFPLLPPWFCGSFHAGHVVTVVMGKL